ncbi:hypothetical protein ACFL3V_03150 [Nanoarchaeota archaeon]
MDNRDLNETLKNIDILRLFKEEPFSVIPTSEIERRLQLSHHPTFRRLKMLEGAGVLLKKSGGHVLDVQNPFVIEIMRFLDNVEKIDARTQDGRDKAGK